MKTKVTEMLSRVELYGLKVVTSLLEVVMNWVNKLLVTPRRSVNAATGKKIVKMFENELWLTNDKQIYTNNDEMVEVSKSPTSEQSNNNDIRRHIGDDCEAHICKKNKFLNTSHNLDSDDHDQGCMNTADATE